MGLLFKTNFKATKNLLQLEISNLCKSEVVSISLASKMKCTQEIPLSASYIKGPGI